MSRKWYPVINYENCTECGACIAKCTHDVYEKNTLVPRVVYPEGCIDGCRGCQNRCPSEAIDYVGDNGDVSSISCCTCD